MTSESNMVKIGIVGAGLMGQLAHLANYATIPNCRVVALADPKPKRRQLIAQRYNIPRTYANHYQLLQDPEVEAVVVVTQRAKMGPIALDCLRAGKHVLTEKPMAATLEQAKLLVTEAHKQGVNYVIGYMKRHDEGVQLGKELLNNLLENQSLGSIIYARFHCFMGEFYCNVDGHIITDETVTSNSEEWAIAPEWIPEAKKSDYAWFLNVYSHNINLLRYLLGQTPSVDYVRFHPQYGKVAVFTFGDYSAVLEAGQFAYRGWDEVSEIYFTNGRLRLESPPGMLKNVPTRVELYKGQGDIHEVYRPQCHWTWAFRRQAEAFIEDIQQGREPIASGADAIEDIRLIEQMWQMFLTA
ncbi:Gfo/Idh/MocA family protein (plasmid) [Crocosphaera watsonii WH 8501]|nr:Gfo/Idh/MocA family oxidoreductase [Crocosphaera watsonii]